MQKSCQQYVLHLSLFLVECDKRRKSRTARGKAKTNTFCSMTGCAVPARLFANSETRYRYQIGFVTKSLRQPLKTTHETKRFNFPFDEPSLRICCFYFLHSSYSSSIKYGKEEGRPVSKGQKAEQYGQGCQKGDTKSEPHFQQAQT